MTYLIENVPFMNQSSYGHLGQASDPTGCWYCSACMVAYHYEAGPRLGVPELHTMQLAGGGVGHHATGTGNLPLGPLPADRAGDFGKNEHQLLLEREGLVRVPQPATHRFSARDLERLLRAGGPMFFYWRKDDGGGGWYGHASVLIGVDTTTNRVTYHDPENGESSTRPLADWNDDLQWGFSYALMQRERTATGAARGVRALAARFGG